MMANRLGVHLELKKVLLLAVPRLSFTIDPGLLARLGGF
jgi:hypothetical protein